MPSSDIIIYQKPDGNIKIDVRLEGELALNATCRKFRQVGQEGELIKEVVCREFRHTTQHRATRFGKPAA